ncbi:hypothetical protein SS1G_06635 [Sclerotinia sclerotiorum 1980 UF-70]|uniref:Impact N-terminal domain-containing protein n=2 Tax=Sclerotinia sclerotiorum (strain ATCC 18683 / 1980 / Ss-1) TaxID=665079 RepID=A7EMT6_SCLS1|nr:hypothetical protein SS1G_06635 [Sclerotinia sclerotiorum 1980 UF-70]APA14648.1 hypothetical protein sscle_13g094180 [Sclerotinia sclerotiorum 1980 UF-70]EDO04152.1 hypothetical protein SS1G_06635 [Sclerotinia sclerotiorum 1980 UF-70]
MASQSDMQDLLRLFTTGRNKVPILTAMQRVKALQTASILPSISAVASTPLDTLQSALSIDEKAAKSLITACKNASKTAGKRSAGEIDTTSKQEVKRVKTFESAYSLPVEQTEEELEKSLELPESVRDEERIKKTKIFTNRAPLVLVWALQLLKYTLPGQKLSGRLSLAQALVSANSKSKAESLGLKGKGKDEDEGKGWPRLKIMGREIGVLKRGGYGSGSDEGKAESEVKMEEEKFAIGKDLINEWAVSTPIVSKGSKFIARSISVSSPSQALTYLQILLKDPSISDASHNVTAFRIQGDHGMIEDCKDDGESGGGTHILGILQNNNMVDVLLVVSRWYGGVMLGPDRWRIMTQVCNDALSQRLRVAGKIGGEQLWGLDIEAMNSSNVGSSMPIHRPEGARRYVFNAFAPPPDDEIGEKDRSKRKKSAKAIAEEKEGNLGLLMGALDLLFESWVDHIGRDELDRRAWGWYVQIRPEVESGVAGWGGKGVVKLSEILALRRRT